MRNGRVFPDGTSILWPIEIEGHLGALLGSLDGVVLESLAACFHRSVVAVLIAEYVGKQQDGIGLLLVVQTG